MRLLFVYAWDIKVNLHGPVDGNLWRPDIGTMLCKHVVTGNYQLEELARVIRLKGVLCDVLE